MADYGQPQRSLNRGGDGPRPELPDFTHRNPTVVTAYTICRTAEHVVDPIQGHWPPDDPTVKTRLINIRVLGHLLSQTRFLSDTAISRVANDILSCQKDTTGTDEEDVEALNKLGEYYRNHLLRPFRNFKGCTPNVSSESSPPSSKLTKEEVDQMLAETPRSYSHSRDLALQREDFRCIVTRAIDRTYAWENRHPEESDSKALEFCHIFVESTDYDIIKDKDNAKKCAYSCNAPWSVLESFGYIKIVDDFATSQTVQVHSLENTMMMIHDLYDSFDTLRLWFEPVEDVPNRYRICSFFKISSDIADGQEIAFQSSDPNRLSLPDPEYLSIHAACCRVAHMSGASRLFDELERDLAADPDPTTEATAFARALHAHLDHLSWRGAVGDL